MFYRTHRAIGSSIGRAGSSSSALAGLPSPDDPSDEVWGTFRHGRLTASFEDENRAVCWRSAGASRALRPPKWALVGASRSTSQVSAGHCRTVQNPCNYWGVGDFTRERATGIEPAFSAWEGECSCRYSRKEPWKILVIGPLTPS